MLVGWKPERSHPESQCALSFSRSIIIMCYMFTSISITIAEISIRFSVIFYVSVPLLSIWEVGSWSWSTRTRIRPVWHSQWNWETTRISHSIYIESYANQKQKATNEKSQNRPAVSSPSTYPFTTTDPPSMRMRYGHAAVWRFLGYIWMRDKTNDNCVCVYMCESIGMGGHYGHPIYRRFANRIVSQMLKSRVSGYIQHTNIQMCKCE